MNLSLGTRLALRTVRALQRYCRVLPVLLVVSLTCPALEAQPKGGSRARSDSARSAGPQDAERAEQAERLFQRGTAAYEARQYKRAYRDLRDAFRLYPTFRTACGLGQIELHLERFRDAAEHLEFCISRFPSHGDEAVRASILNGLAEARRHVAVFVPQVSQRDATVFINAEPVGVTPLAHDLYVEPGRRRVTVKKPGFRNAAVELFFPAGGRRDVRIELQAGTAASGRALSSSDGGGPLLLIGGAVSVATVGFGAAMLWSATGLERDASTARDAAHSTGCYPGKAVDPCLYAREAVDRATARRELATSIMLSGAGVGVLTGLSYLLWRSFSGAETHDQELPLTVALSASTATFVMGGAF